jgi:hypothetical protein
MNNMSKKKQTQSQPQSCLNCKFADYLKTRTGKPMKGESVKCRFPRLSEHQMREALKDILPESMIDRVHCPYPNGMWSDMGSFGANCSQWMPVEGEGESDGK